MSWHAAAHTPNDEDQKHLWQERHGWEEVHYWDKPQYPTKFLEASCYKCHQDVRSEMQKVSHHPVREGKMTCFSCHDPHGSITTKNLRAASVNELCYDCHTEKRGPFLWEHAPVTEDCTLCHNPHGSNHEALLKQRPPLLCQQCHSPGGHPALAYTSETAQNTFQQRFMLAQSCTNCHSQVHGSNHPSGVTDLR